MKIARWFERNDADAAHKVIVFTLRDIKTRAYLGSVRSWDNTKALDVTGEIMCEIEQRAIDHGYTITERD